MIIVNLLLNNEYNSITIVLLSAITKKGMIIIQASILSLKKRTNITHKLIIFILILGLILLTIGTIAFIFFFLIHLINFQQLKVIQIGLFAIMSIIILIFPFIFHLKLYNL